MSKSKSSAKGAKGTKSDVLTKVKDAGVTKPAQTVKAKSKDLAKAVAAKEDKKSKKGKKVKEPTPEPSSESEEESASSESSEEESEVEVKKPVKNGKVNGAKKPAAKEESSDQSASDSDESESPDEKASTNGTRGKAPAVTATKADASDDSEGDSDSESDSDASHADVPPAVEDDSADSSDESSEDEKPATKVAKANTKSNAQDVSDSESSEDSDSDASDESEAEVETKPTKRKAEDAGQPAAKKTKTEAVDTSRGNNLFVGNLSWNVDEAWLKETFEEHGEVSGCRIMTDRDTGRSKGFGYVEFTNAEDAAKAHAAKQQFELDNRALNVDFANARPDNKDKQDNRRKSYGDQVSEQSDTLFLGNLSFDVGQEQVSEAFSPYGTILSVRLPTDRETGQPKGFGYVTFSTVEEAKGALEAMQGGYVGSRPVRLDYSTPRPAQGDSPAGRGRGRGGFGGGRGGSGFGGRGGGRGGRGGSSFGGRGGGGGRGGRGGSTNRGGFGDFSGRKQTFDE